MALLAETLLLAKGANFPTHEKAVIKAMDSLEEPPYLIARRQARMRLSDTITKEVIREVGDTNPRAAEYLNHVRTSEAWGMTFKDGHCNLVSMDENFDFEVELPNLTIEKIMNMLDEDTRRYLRKDAEMMSGYESAVFLRAILSTGGIYRLDGGELGTQGVLDSIWGGLPFTDLPKLPYPRMWFEARDENNQPVPLWRGNPPEGAWNAADCGELWGMAISELAQGTSWAIVAVRHPEWFYSTTKTITPEASRFVRTDEDAPVFFDTHRYERVDLNALKVLPPTQDGIWIMEEESNERYTSEANYRAAMMAWAIVLADIVTARNVDRRETFMSSKVRKQMTRAAPMKKFDARVYNVSISTASDDAKDETGNHLHVRFMVRGHWRISDAPHAEYVEAKEYTCVWVRSHIKGPPGAPWKGRPIYVEPKEK